MEKDKEVLLHIRQTSRQSSTSSPTNTADDDGLLEGQRRLGRGQEWGDEDGEAEKLGKLDRALPFLVLIALVFMLLASGTGIAFSVLAGVRSVADGNDLPSRIVVFTACVVGVVYVLIHLGASRMEYWKKEHGSPQMYGNYLHAICLLVVRIGLPVWITAIVTTSLVVVKIGVNFSGMFGDSRQTIYINFLVSVVGFMSSALLIFCIEISSTPFATALFSKRSFLSSRGRRPMVEVRGPDPFLHAPAQQSTPRMTLRQYQQHRALNSTDRSKGTWPGPQRRSRSIVSSGSVYSTNSRGSRAEDDGFKLISSSAPSAPPLAIRSDSAAADLPISVPLIPFNPEAPSPVHLSWRPPSHGGPTSKRHSRHASLMSAAGMRPFPQELRQPTLPTVPSKHAVGTSSSSSSSNMRMTWAPMLAPRQRQQNVLGQGSLSEAAAASARDAGRRHTMVSPRSPFGTFAEPSLATMPRAAGPRPPSMPMPMPMPKAVLPIATVPIHHPVHVPAPHVSASVRLQPQPRSLKTPSPRAMSLRSHPPFAQPLVKSTMTTRSALNTASSTTASNRPKTMITPTPVPQPKSAPKPMATFVPPPSWAVMSSTQIQRPRTAPGLRSAPPMEPPDFREVPPEFQRVPKRKPVSGQTTVVVAEEQETKVGNDADRNTDADEESEDEEGRGSDLSRTARRLQKEKQRELAARAQTVRQHNFSRPLPRSKSMSNMHRRSRSEHDDRTSFEIISGGFVV